MNIKKILDLTKRNCGFSPLEGEKKFLSELYELRNFREGYNLKYICPVQLETVLKPSPTFVMLTGVRKRLLPLTKREGNDSVISYGFTLAEVLITIGIIGIVATIIMPAVISITKDKQYKAARYKALSTIGTASKNISVQDNMNNAQNAKDFVNNILSTQISIAKTCENDKLENCGISKKIKTINNDNIDMPQSSLKTGQHGTESRIGEMYRKEAIYKSYGFLTGDGYAYNLFYFPNCSGNRPSDKDGFINTIPYTCINAIYDMNGLRGPNQVGKDIGFVTVYYPNETVQAVAPMPEKDVLKGTYTLPNAQQACADRGKRIPTLEEGMSVTLNSKLVNSNLPQEFIWTSWSFKNEYGYIANYIITLYYSTLYSHHKSSANLTLCVDE